MASIWTQLKWTFSKKQGRGQKAISEEDLNHEEQNGMERGRPEADQQWLTIRLDTISEQLKTIRSWQEKQVSAEDEARKDALLSRLQQQLDSFETELAGKRALMRDYEALLAPAPSLKVAGSGVHRLLLVLNGVREQAGKAYEDAITTNADSPNTGWVAAFNGKYLSSLALDKIAKWQYISRVLGDQGYIADGVLAELYNRSDSTEEDKQRQFIRSAFTEVLETYISASLILCEELKQLQRFSHVQDAIADQVRVVFEPLVDTIREAARMEVDLEVNYLPLFVNQDDYGGFAKVRQQPLHRLYSEMLPVAPDHVQEIRKYGFERRHDFENPDTYVITNQILKSK